MSQLKQLQLLLDETNERLQNTSAPYQSHEYLQLLAYRCELWRKIDDLTEGLA